MGKILKRACIFKKRCLELKIADTYDKLWNKSGFDVQNEKIDEMRKQRITDCKNLLKKLDELE